MVASKPPAQNGFKLADGGPDICYQTSVAYASMQNSVYNMMHNRSCIRLFITSGEVGMLHAPRPLFGTLYAWKLKIEDESYACVPEYIKLLISLTSIQTRN